MVRPEFQCLLQEALRLAFLGGSSAGISNGGRLALLWAALGRRLLLCSGVRGSARAFFVVGIGFSSRALLSRDLSGGLGRGWRSDLHGGGSDALLLQETLVTLGTRATRVSRCSISMVRSETYAAPLETIPVSLTTPSQSI